MPTYPSPCASTGTSRPPTTCSFSSSPRKGARRTSLSTSNSWKVQRSSTAPSSLCARAFHLRSTCRASAAMVVEDYSTCSRGWAASGSATHLRLANPDNGVGHHMRKNRCKDSVQSPRRDALEGERPILDRIGLTPQELLDGPLVPLVERAVRIVDLLLRPHCELGQTDGCRRMSSVSFCSKHRRTRASGKSPVSYTLSSVVSAYWLIQEEKEGSPCFQTCNHLDYFRKEKGRRSKPRVFDDGDLNLEHPAGVKAVTASTGRLWQDTTRPRTRRISYARFAVIPMTGPQSRRWTPIRLRTP